jgi:hypothetical protein
LLAGSARTERSCDWTSGIAGMETSAAAVLLAARSPNENMDLSGPIGEGSFAGLEGTVGVGTEEATPESRANMSSREPLASTERKGSSILERGIAAAEEVGRGLNAG